MEFQDKTLNCSDCGAPFVFTAGEQSFYQEKGFAHEPKRCRDCRSKRKTGGGGGRGGEAGGEGPPRGGRSEGRGGGEYHTATCSACGGQARLSFKPSPDRPVFCRTCFQARSGAGGNR